MDFLSNNHAWNFGHVKREANKVVDLLANVGIDGGQRIREGQLATFGGAEWEARCRHLANADLEAPRGGGGDT